MPLVKPDRSSVGLVGEECDATETVGLSVTDRVFEQSRSNSLALLIGPDDHVFQPARFRPFGRADREKKANHSHDLTMDSGGEDASRMWIVHNQPQPADLLLAVGRKIGILGKQGGQQIRQLRNVAERGLSMD